MVHFRNSLAAKMAESSSEHPSGVQDQKWWNNFTKERKPRNIVVWYDDGDIEIVLILRYNAEFSIHGRKQHYWGKFFPQNYASIVVRRCFNRISQGQEYSCQDLLHNLMEVKTTPSVISSRCSRNISSTKTYAKLFIFVNIQGKWDWDRYFSKFSSRSLWKSKF